MALAARHMARNKKKSRRQQLEEAKAYQAGLEEQKLQQWLEKYDRDQDGGLDKDEFAELVKGLDETEDVDQEAIDKLFAKAQGGKDVDKDNKEQIKEAVMRYKEYLAHHEYLDQVMRKFDKDGSGALDKVEIKAMLETILKDGASLVVHSKGRAYKLETLEAAHASGRLDKTTYRDKVNKVTGTEPGAAPSIMEVTDDDVDFVMAEADLDKNGTLDKEEVLASLAAWTTLLKRQTAAGAESASCSLM